MNFYYAESGIRPSEVDTTSSKTYNYIRRNIREVERTDPDTGETITMYEYEECKILKDDWGLYLEILRITPYKETKTAYYGESEKVFYDVPQGNITVFWDNYNGNYAVERIADRIVVSFDALTDNATLSIMIQ